MLKKMDFSRRQVLTIFLIIVAIGFLGALTYKNHGVKMFAGTKTGNENPVDSYSYPNPQSGFSITHTGSNSQPIELSQGLAEFNVSCPGRSNISVYILSADGDPVASIADSKGPYKRIKMVYVPQTGTYILDVKCEGEWSVSKN